MMTKREKRERRDVGFASRDGAAFSSCDDTKADDALERRALCRPIGHVATATARRRVVGLPVERTTRGRREDDDDDDDDKNL